MADPERAACSSVGEGDVRAAVVGEELLDLDPVPAVERPRAPEETDGCAGFLVCEDLGVGETGAIVDRDVNAFPADDRARRAARSKGRVAARPSSDPMPSASLDPAELLDV